MTGITKVGIGVLVIKNATILLGKRKGSHGAEEWGLPGGSLEYGESFAGTAKREMLEEIGPQVRTTFPVPISVINLTEYMPKHYIDIGMACVWISGEPEVMEPDKCEEWKWFSIHELPTPLFATVPKIIAAYLFGCKSNIYDVQEYGR